MQTVSLRLCGLLALAAGALFAADIKMSPGGSQRLTAVVVDQFGDPMATQPPVVWSTTIGQLSVHTGASTILTAPDQPGSGLVTAVSASLPAKQRTIAVDKITGPTPVTGAFVEIDGMVVIEAEHAHRLLAQGNPWTVTDSKAGFAGTGYLTTKVDNSAAAWASSDRAQFNIHVTNPGSYAVWLRVSHDGGKSNSAYLGLNGQQLGGTFDNQSGSGWYWRKHGVMAELAQGLHIFTVGKREGGYRVDRVLLTSNLQLVPVGLGPAESARHNAPTKIQRRISMNGILHGGVSWTWSCDPVGVTTIDGVQISFDDLDATDSHVLSLSPAAVN